MKPSNLRIGATEMRILSTHLCNGRDQASRVAWGHLEGRHDEVSYFRKRAQDLEKLRADVRQFPKKDLVLLAKSCMGGEEQV